MNNPAVKKIQISIVTITFYICTVPIYEKQSVDASWNDRMNIIRSHENEVNSIE